MAYYNQQQLDELQLSLAGAGFIPGPVGIAADLADAGVSLYRGDLLGAGLAGMAAIPGLGMAFAGRHALKYGRPLQEAVEGGLDYYSFGRRADDFDEFAGLSRLSPSEYAQIPGVRQAMRQREPVFARSRAAAADAIGDDPGIALRIGDDIPSPGAPRQLPPRDPEPPVIPEPFREGLDDHSVPRFEQIARETGLPERMVGDYFRRLGITEDVTPPMRSLDEAFTPPKERPLLNQLADPLGTGRSTSAVHAQGPTGFAVPAARMTEEEAAIEYLTKKAFKSAMDSRFVQRVPLVTYTIGKTQFDNLFEWSMGSEAGKKGHREYITVGSIKATTPDAIVPTVKALLIPSDFAYDPVSPDRLPSSFYQALSVDPAQQEEALKKMGLTPTWDRIPDPLQIPFAPDRPLAPKDPGASAGDLGLAARLGGAGILPPGAKEAPLTDEEYMKMGHPPEAAGFGGEEGPGLHERRLARKDALAETDAAREAITGNYRNEEEFRLQIEKPLDDWAEYSSEDIARALNNATKRLNIESRKWTSGPQGRWMVGAGAVGGRALVSRMQRKEEIKDDNPEFYVDPEDEFESGRGLTEEEEEGVGELEAKETNPGDTIQVKVAGGGSLTFEVVDIKRDKGQWKLELSPVLDDPETIQRIAEKRARWQYKQGGSLQHWGMLQTPGEYASAGDRYPIPVVEKMQRVVENANSVESQMHALSQFSTEELEQIVMAIKTTNVTQRILNKETKVWELPDKDKRTKVPADVPRALAALLDKRKAVLLHLENTPFAALDDSIKDDFAQAMISFSRAVGVHQGRVGAPLTAPGEREYKRREEDLYGGASVQEVSPEQANRQNVREINELEEKLSLAMLQDPGSIVSETAKRNIAGQIEERKRLIRQRGSERELDEKKKILSTVVLPILARYGIKPESPPEELVDALHDGADTADLIDPHSAEYEHMAGRATPFRGEGQAAGAFAPKYIEERREKIKIDPQRFNPQRVKHSRDQEVAVTLPDGTQSAPPVGGLSKHEGVFSQQEIAGMEKEIRWLIANKDKFAATNTVIQTGSKARKNQRTQINFGYFYSYGNLKSVTGGTFPKGVQDPTKVAVEPMPTWLNQVIDRLIATGAISEDQRPNSALINVYPKDSGSIPPHVDHVPSFDRPITTIRLGAPAVMSFGYAYTGKDGKGATEKKNAKPQPKSKVSTPFDVPLGVGDVHIMAAEVANKVTHAIFADGVSAGESFSITLRQIHPDLPENPGQSYFEGGAGAPAQAPNIAAHQLGTTMALGAGLPGPNPVADFYADPLGNISTKPQPPPTLTPPGAGVPPGVTKIISGGQDGADQMGIRIGQQLGLKTGGVAPSGFATSSGAAPWLQEVGLREVSQEEVDTYVGGKDKKYGPRTAMNIVNSDATFLFTRKNRKNSPGARLTRSLARKERKPLLEIGEYDSVESIKKKVSGFMARHPGIQTLNIAGNREFTGPEDLDEGTLTAMGKQKADNARAGARKRENIMRTAINAAQAGVPMASYREYEEGAGAMHPIGRDPFRELMGLPKKPAPRRKLGEHTKKPKEKFKVHTMSYKMYSDKNVTGRYTNTLDLAKRGIRTSTTRSFPLGEVGEIIRFRGTPRGEVDPTDFVITGTHQITQELFDNPAFWSRLSETEGWTEEWLRNSKMIKVGNWITTYEKVK